MILTCHIMKIPAFTRRNVFLRDRYQCQYCSKFFRTADLSLDHVHPRCMGGQLNWENTVTSCKKCNGRKGSLTVSQLRSVGMKLLREPVVPSSYELAAVAGRMMPRRVHPTWAPYLGMNQAPIEDLATEKTEKLGVDSYFDDVWMVLRRANNHGVKCISLLSLPTGEGLLMTTFSGATRNLYPSINIIFKDFLSSSVSWQEKRNNKTVNSDGDKFVFHLRLECCNRVILS